ncbi:DNA repair protein [Scheffersomyces stipitis CBS 6054]|uniref:DNA repair protein REV1 n=1 Tax=Scheffersomyces stipitis (strain ATCC 58785 / CBS 6054 / NBRC 10063 / NRRL Y-11545) TaxID=322104 RepID=A3GH67_PICST|nr:DNA repair protein [Scheffersomyces stipitis CBS 6054]EAZ62767.2 DNA repair protein [Scheffersomyces stipitis CBS 6054]
MESTDESEDNLRESRQSPEVDQDFVAPPQRVSQIDSVTYSSFLRSLDDEHLIEHINSCSQSKDHSQITASIHDSKLIASSPRTNRVERQLSLDEHNFSSVSTDPFDDDLDSQLLGASTPTRATANPNDDSADAYPDDEQNNTVGEIHAFGDYATYFRTKHLKQQKEDEEYIKWDLKRRAQLNGGRAVAVKPIFEGCIVYVNGHTNPSINEIHRLIIVHSGKFISYLSNKGAATHIICDRLTPKKKVEYRNYKVVRAQWVVDCVASNELLDWTQYRLISEIEYGQKRLQFGDSPTRHSGSDSVTPSNESDSELANSMADNNEDPLLEELEDDFIEPIEPSGSNDVGSKGEKKIMDAKHPEFLKHFFANSRLHHLSMWKADLKLRFLRRIVKENKSGETKRTSQGIRVIFHVDFDCFFATASCLNRPELDINKDPIAVTHGGKSSDVASCNYVARNFGVKNGMWVSQAKKLCPNLIMLDYDYKRYESYSSEFYNYFLSYDIFDSIFPVSIDEVLIDASSHFAQNEENLVDMVNALSTRIRDDIFKFTKCSVSVGVSRNVMLAKLALRKAKPNGQFFLYEGVDEFLDSISVKSLPGIGRSIQERLADVLNQPKTMDIYIRDLKAFSKTKLISILGDKTGVKLYEYARGIDDTSLVIDTSNPEALLGRKSVSVDVNFGIRFDTVSELDDFLIRIAKELYSRLISLGVCGSNLTLKLAKRAPGAAVNPAKYLGMGYCDFVNKSSHLGVPTNDWGIIGSELKALYRMVNVPVKELRGISISLTKLRDVENLKSSKQMKLPFKKTKELVRTEFGAFSKLKPIDSIQIESGSKRKSNIAEGNVNISGYHDYFNKESEIDWEVLDALPWDLRREIQKELERRGMIPVSPSKAPPGTKAYLQQLIPTQIGSTPKYVRVFEKPQLKSPRKRQKLHSKSPSPNKQVMVGESQFYDCSVINELPLNIKAEVLKDMKYRKKVKEFDMTALKDKVSMKYEKSKAMVDEVSSEWISQQRTILQRPKFLNEKVSVHQVKLQLDKWIQSSLIQKGPHVDDVHVFASYLKDLSKQNVNSSMILINHIWKVLKYHESILAMSVLVESDEVMYMKEGIAEWKSSIDVHLLPIVDSDFDI